MSLTRSPEQMPPNASFNSFIAITKQSRDASPQANLYIPRPSDNKHAGSIRPYKPKKLTSNTPSPLGHKDQSEGSKSRLDSKSISKGEVNSKKLDTCRLAKKKSS